MRFSILIPVYNAQNYLEECLDSIYEQSFQDFEVILIDDGSTDNSGIICDYYQNRYSHNTRVIHKQNEGLLRARRDSLYMAQGEYIIFCDSDDFIEQDSLSLLDSKIVEFQPDIIQYDLFTFSKRGEYYNINCGKFFLESNKRYDDISILQETLLNRKYCIWSMAGKCVKRELFDIKNDYRDFQHIKFGEDSLQSLEIYLSAHNFVYVTDRIYCYRSFSGMTNKLPRKYLNDFFEISKFFEKQKERFVIKDVEKNIALFNMNIIYEYLLNISLNEYSLSEFRGLMEYVNGCTDFREKYNLYVINKADNRKLNLLMKLVYKKHYVILHFLLRIRHEVKN